MVTNYEDIDGPDVKWL